MNPDLRLTHIAPLSAKAFYLRATSRARDEQGADLTIVLRNIDGQWGSYQIDAPVVDHCAFDDQGRHVVSLTPFGAAHIARASGFSWEELDADPATAPNRLRHMRALARVGHEVIAVGMSRMAYRRYPDGRWERIDMDLRSDIPTQGLLAVAGCGLEYIVACGFGGEAWRFNGSSWSRLPVPTNVKLDQVCVPSPEIMALAGAGGAMFVCQKETWTELQLTDSKRTLWGLAHFDGRFYAADSANVYVLDGEQLKVIDLPVEGASTGRLRSCDGRLWSVGERDLMVFDGQRWSVVSCP